MALPPSRFSLLLPTQVVASCPFAAHDPHSFGRELARLLLAWLPEAAAVGVVASAGGFSSLQSSVSFGFSPPLLLIVAMVGCCFAKPEAAPNCRLFSLGTSIGVVGKLFVAGSRARGWLAQSSMPSTL